MSHLHCVQYVYCTYNPVKSCEPEAYNPTEGPIEFLETVFENTLPVAGQTRNFDEEIWTIQDVNQYKIATEEFATGFEPEVQAKTFTIAVCANTNQQVTRKNWNNNSTFACTYLDSKGNVDEENSLSILFHEEDLPKLTNCNQIRGIQVFVPEDGTRPVAGFDRYLLCYYD